MTAAGIAVDEVAEDVVVTRLVASPRVRIATIIPSLIVPLYTVATGEIVRPLVVVAIVGVVMVLAVVGALRLYGGDPAVDERARRREQQWQVTAIALGFGLTVPFFLAVEVDVEVMAGVYGFVWVMGAFVFHVRYRRWLMTWIGVVWLAVLITNGVTDPVVLATHGLGAGLLVAVVTAHARRLMRSLLDATEARRRAEQRANLLASLLRTNTLDPDRVLTETVRGLIDVGFDFATIRMLDHGRRVASLVEGATRDAVELPEQLGFDEGEFGLVASTGRARMIRRAVREPEHVGFRPIHDVYVLPLRDGDEVEATISVGTSHRPIDPVLEEAADLLTEQASAAFTRARSYRADARIVSELRRIELRTREYVISMSHELRTPLTVLQGLGRTLQERWFDLDPAERAELTARMSNSATRLTAAVGALSESTVLDAASLEVDVASVNLRDVVQRRLTSMRVEERGWKIAVDIDAGVSAYVDAVLFGYLLDEVVSYVFSRTRNDTGRHVTGEVVARTLGDRTTVTVALGDSRTLTPSKTRSLGLSRRGWLGVGLSMAEEIVQAHDGRLIVGDEAASFDVAASPPA